MSKQAEQAGGPSSPRALCRLDRLSHSPAVILIAVAVCAFASETSVQIVLTRLSLVDDPIHPILDSLMMVILLFPALIVLVQRPVELQLARRRRAEEELALERTKLGKILDALPIGISIVNRSHGIEYTNAALVDEFGPAAGQTCHDYFQGWPDVCPGCRLDEAFAGKSVTWEWRSEKSGKIYEIFDTPLEYANGSLSTLHIVRDITARKLGEDELRGSRERLRSLSAHLQRAREEERTAISREIHDELGQVLATVQLGVSSLAEQYHDHRHLIDKISGMKQLLTGAIRTVQRISTQLRPAILDELGLAEAIEWQAAEFRERTGIACTPDILLLETNYRRDVATTAFRIFQEALTNVIRHAGASRVDVSVEERNRRIVLVVADNGRGITPQQVRDGRSLGITGMRERAYALGGRVRICRSLEGGTAVIAHIPIDSQGGDP